MKTRVAFVAALITVLASACNNKVWIDCTTSTVTRTKNKALNWSGPVPTTPLRGAAPQC